ncbi:hypothetical protein ACFPK5_20850 [Streptomyces beijiangensis]|uniref:hypothetical protein n=1 Tax=Streptomyces beijiangensis TaxID=163361 RepID=UPI00361E0BE9
MKSGTDRLSPTFGKLKTAAGQSTAGLRNVKTAASQADSGIGKARSGTDKFKASLDKLKGAAGGAHKALKDVKSQADAVEKSVGKAGKGADGTGKSMGGLGKGLKGASLAQKGLNTAMKANAFGLIMTLLAPLISKFVNMDKIIALVQKGAVIAWKAIVSATKNAVNTILPIVKGYGNAMLMPIAGIARAYNALASSLGTIHVSVPSWIPKYGGRKFEFNLPQVPVPHLANGGVVRARSGGMLSLIGEGGEDEAVIPLSKLERMLGQHPGGGAALHRLAAAVEQLAERPVHVDVDSQTIARAVFNGQRQLARR